MCRTDVEDMVNKKYDLDKGLEQQETITQMDESMQIMKEEIKRVFSI